MGAVYEAVDERLSRTVALKETLAETDELKRAFEREARLLANLRHPVLPKVIDHFSEDDGQFLVMEYIPGSDLGELLERRARPFSPDEVAAWADDLLDALDHLHTNDPPIIHRDIKPSNLKLTAKGKIILLDFGLAKGFAGQMTRTSSGMSVVGYTLHYAALEQIQGERTGPRSDLYSLAATLYQLLTARIPVDALKRAADMLNDDEDPLPSITSINPDVPASFASVLMKALSLKPSLRPASAAEMRASLHETSPVAAHVAPVADDEMTMVSVTPGAPGRLPPIAIGGEKTMVLDSSMGAPLGPNGSGTLEQDVLVDRESNAKKWWLIGGGACMALILIVGIYLLARRSGETTVTPPTAPTAFDAVPLPFRDALPSVAALSMQDAEGKTLRQVSGFFFKTDELATSINAIEGATQGRVTFVGQSGAYEVTGVTGLDREHGLVTLKVARAKAPALAIGGKKQTTLSDKVGILGSGAKAAPVFAPGAITAYLDDDRIEVGAQAAPTVVGGPLLNAQGEVIGIITDSPAGRAIAVPVNYLADLIRRKGQAMTLALAGAKDVLYDWRKTEGFKPATIDKELEKRIIEAVARAHREKPPAPTPQPGPQASPQTGENPGQGDRPWFMPDEMDTAIVTGVSTGAFTTPGVPQTAYLIDTRSGSHADNFGPKYLAIFNGETYVADFPVANLSLILQTFDLNRDGINELLLGYSYTQMGEYMEWAKLVQVSQSKLRVIRDFGTTHHSTCGSDNASDKGIDSSVVFYAPASTNQMPDFRVDNYRAACPPEGTEIAPEQWKYTSTGKLPDK
jgi:S1-C subfamily serine protease